MTSTASTRILRINLEASVRDMDVLLNINCNVNADEHEAARRHDWALGMREI